MKFQRRYLLFAVVLTLFYFVSAIAAPVLEGAFGILRTNALVFSAPRNTADIIGGVFVNDTVALLTKAAISDGGQFYHCSVEQGRDRIEGYIAASCIETISMHDAQSYQIASTNSGIRIVSGSNTYYQFPTPVQNVWLNDNDGPNDGRIDVYDAPGTKSHRSVTKKGTQAYVHVNEAVTLLATDDGWGLIEYKTTTGYRRGYIPSNCIPGDAYRRAGALPKAQITGIVHTSTEIVNDTTRSSDNYVIQYIYTGDSITVLAFEHSNYTDWAYVETVQNNKVARGFVPMSAINVY